MSGPYTGLRPNNETGVAYMRRTDASFDGYHLNIYLKNDATRSKVTAPNMASSGTDVAGATALYECTFNSGDILGAESVNGHPSVYKLGLNTGSGSYSESLFTTDIPDAVGVPAGGPDPIVGDYIMPPGVVAPLSDPWADPETL